MAEGVPDHFIGCHAFRPRRERWEAGWVDLAAYAIPPEGAEGWPEVDEGPVFLVIEGGFGPEALRLANGPWVRHPDPSIPTHRRVEALAARLAAGVEPRRAVTEVVKADGAAIERWRRPEVLTIDTTGCGRAHQVVIRQGVAEAVDHGGSAPQGVDEATLRFASDAACAAVVDAWERADAGRVVGDLTAGAVPQYRVVGGDPGIIAAQQVVRALVRARARRELVEAGEPDRWVWFDIEVAPAGEPAALYPSTRPVPVALIRAPATWPWSAEPLG